MSLDALKGFDMFWILMPTYPIFHSLLVAMGLGGCWMDRQMAHLPWNGFTFYDTIFPLFLFMSGVGFSYSLVGSRRRGVSDARILFRVLKRAIVLVLLGSTIFGSLELNAKTFTLFSVLGRIGISCGLAGFIWIVFPRYALRGIVFALILAFYGFLPFVVACPGAPAGSLPYVSRELCLYAWMDGNVFPQPLFAEGFVGVFSMIATAMMGIGAGDWIRRGDVSGERRTLGLLLVSVAALAVGLMFAYGFGRFSIPINKPIWSATYVLVTGAYSMAMLAVFFWIIDVKGWRSWSFPFRIIGMNVLFAYLASRTFFPFRWEMKFMFGGVSRLMPTSEWGEFVGQFGYCAVYWLILYALYKKNWFFKA